MSPFILPIVYPFLGLGLAFGPLLTLISFPVHCTVLSHHLFITVIIACPKLLQEEPRTRKPLHNVIDLDLHVKQVFTKGGYQDYLSPLPQVCLLFGSRDVHVSSHKSIDINTHTYSHTYIHTCMHAHIHTNMCMYICMYVCMCGCGCVCACMCLALVLINVRRRSFKCRFPLVYSFRSMLSLNYNSIYVDTAEPKFDLVHRLI